MAEPTIEAHAVVALEHVIAQAVERSTGAAWTTAIDAARELEALTGRALVRGGQGHYWIEKHLLPKGLD